MTEACNLRVGVIGIEGAWSTEVLADALEQRTGFRGVIDLADAVTDLDAGTVRASGIDLHELDGVVVKKLDKAYSPDMFPRLDILRYLESRGVRVFSRPACIAGMLNRLGCTATLRTHDVPMPPTEITEDLGHAAAAVRRFGKAVLKPLYSTKARGMTLVSADQDDLEVQLADYKAAGNPCLYLQKVLPLPDRDYGVVFLGDEYLGAYARVRGQGAWSTVSAQGGHYACYEAPPRVIELARRAGMPFGLDYTSVDVAEVDGEYVVFEVSAFGGFRGLRDGCGLDVAPRYADHVVRELRGT